MSAHLDLPFDPTVLHLFSGSGGGALGFKRACVRVGLQEVRFRSVGALDYDARACADLERLTGEKATLANIGAMGPADLAAVVRECPDVLFTSAPCVGFSGCLPEETSKTAKYQAYNSLAYHGIDLALEAWKHRADGRNVPGLIIFENVPRIQSRGKELLKHLTALLQRSGYAVKVSTHNCGEIGKGIAQNRRRFLLVARHMATCPDFLREPPKQRVLAIKEVLWRLPVPRPGGPDRMHRLPSLSALNWLRLACIFASGDWRCLPAEVLLYHCESHELETVTGIRWKHCAGRHDGKLGVLDWEKPARTIIGKARVCNTWNAAADPRVAWPADKHGGRPDAYGMTKADVPSGAVRGTQTIYTAKASVPDPRVATSYDSGEDAKSGILGVTAADDAARAVLGAATIRNAPVSAADARVADVALPLREQRKNGGRGVADTDQPAHAVLAEGSVSNTRVSVADARLAGDDHAEAQDHDHHPASRPDGGHGRPAGDAARHHAGRRQRLGTRVSAAVALTCGARAGAYGNPPADAPSPTIVGHHKHDRTAAITADPRLDHEPRRGSHGMLDGGEPADTIRGHHTVRQAPASAPDPRLGKGRKPKRAKPVPLEVRYDERGWPVPTHELVLLDDGRFVLYGPAIDFADARPRSDIVIRAPDGTLHRPLTDAELAALQDFPLDFEFCGPSSCSKTPEGAPPLTGRRKRIGNAVPPGAAEAIAVECLETLIASYFGGFRLASWLVWVAPEAMAA